MRSLGIERPTKPLDSNYLEAWWVSKLNKWLRGIKVVSVSLVDIDSRW